MTKWILLGGIAVVLFFMVWKSKQPKPAPATALQTTNTNNQPPDQAWKGWQPFTDWALKNLTAYVNSFEAGKSSIQNTAPITPGGGAATGTLSASTSGGGAGKPLGSGVGETLSVTNWDIPDFNSIYLT